MEVARGRRCQKNKDPAGYRSRINAFKWLQLYMGIAMVYDATDTVHNRPNPVRQPSREPLTTPADVPSFLYSTPSSALPTAGFIAALSGAAPRPILPASGASSIQGGSPAATSSPSAPAVHPGPHRTPSIATSATRRPRPPRSGRSVSTIWAVTAPTPIPSRHGTRVSGWRSCGRTATPGPPGRGR